MTKRGQLRVYLGCAPGVGKTYAMLDEGHRRAVRGTDVVVGYVETHGRPNTARMLDGLEVIPRRGEVGGDVRGQGPRGRQLLLAHVGLLHRRPQPVQLLGQVVEDGVDERNLVVSAAYVDEGPTMKRFRPRAQGRASRINKRTSHITVVVTPKTANTKGGR